MASLKRMFWSVTHRYRRGKIIWAALFTIVTGLTLLGSEPDTRKPQFSTWSTPVSLGPVLNSVYGESVPALSRRGLSLYLTSNRPGGFGGPDIWVSRRTRVDGPWGPPVNLGLNINTGFAEWLPVLSPDDHWLFFSTERPGGLGGQDIWVSWRRDVRDDFGWQKPVNVAGGVNSAQDDYGGSSIARHGLGSMDLYFISNRPGGLGGDDIYVSTRFNNGVFGPATLLSELNSPQNDRRPAIRGDGLEIFLSSSRPGLGPAGTSDLFVATRDTLSGTWSVPENIGDMVNAPSDESLPTLSADGRSLFFTAGAPPRPGVLGAPDIFVTTRTRLDTKHGDDDSGMVETADEDGLSNSDNNADRP